MSRIALLALLFASPALADEVNIYSHRQPELIQPLLDQFTAETGIAVNRSWEVVPYSDPSAWFKGILDVGFETTEEGEDYTAEDHADFVRTAQASQLIVSTARSN